MCTVCTIYVHFVWSMYTECEQCMYYVFVGCSDWTWLSETNKETFWILITPVLWSCINRCVSLCVLINQQVSDTNSQKINIQFDTVTVRKHEFAVIWCWVGMGEEIEDFCYIPTCIVHSKILNNQQTFINNKAK